MYYVIWPYDHRKVTILSTHATMKAAYAYLDLLGDVVESSPDGLNPYVVDENHLPQDYLPPNQLPVGEPV